jgi:hypothetical protein
MAKGSKTPRKQTERTEKPTAKPASDEPLTDPLSAFPADPPKQNVLLLVGSALLFAIWFFYLAYVALRS